MESGEPNLEKQGEENNWIYDVVRPKLKELTDTSIERLQILLEEEIEARKAEN